MNLKQRLLDYMLITCFVWGMYLLWLIPYQYYIVKLTPEQLWLWLWSGTLLEMVFTYPIAKAVARYAPKISKWVEVHG